MNSKSEPAAAPAEPRVAGSAMRDLAPRVLSAIVMIALALGTLWIGGHAFALFWLAAGFAVFWEWQKMVGGDRVRARLIVGACALAASASFAFDGGVDMAVLLLLAGGFVTRASRRTRQRDLGRPRARLRRRPGRLALRASRVDVCRDDRDLVAVRRRLGHRYHGLFWRPAHRRTETLAARFAIQDLVGLHHAALSAADCWVWPQSMR